MDQMTFDDLMETNPGQIPELIHCPLTEDYHWLRITVGHTPTQFKGSIEFELAGYEYMYKDTPFKDSVMSAFSGNVRLVDWKNETQ
ncbi:hypothetical protein [Sporosarcina sp. FSL K6-5500]|uniref:hypothetical protein n=1 Tax=Sporosarcina sp. FSL K6-5500 TaxID=2921558 RepID=UPI0030FA90F7